jgi:hypothetical protein
MSVAPKTKIISDANMHLPAHLLAVENMSAPPVVTKLCDSKGARSWQYECHPFYKSISRVIQPRRENRQLPDKHEG